jgi:hypothetical protein
MEATSSSTVKSVLEQRGRTAIPMRGPLGLVRKTVLLNLGIILSALAIAATLGRPAAFLIITILVPMVSIVLWAATFAISAFVSILRIFRRQDLWEPRPQYQAGTGVGDEWLDGPA